jgi:hypothetical protein
MTNELAPIRNPLRERIKYALAVVLALVLGGVVYQSTRSAPLPAPISYHPPKAAVAVSETSALQMTSARVWPELSLEEVIAFDPFLPPAGAEPALVAVVEAEPDESTETKPAEVPKPAARLQAIYRRGDHAAALINSRSIEPGGLLDGRRVVEIGPTDVLMEE